MQSHESRALVQKTVEYCYNKKNHDKNELRRQWNGLQVHDLKAYNQFSVVTLNVIRDMKGAAAAKKWDELQRNLSGEGFIDPCSISLM